MYISTLAAESLQSIVIYMIGHSNDNINNNNKSQYTDIYKMIFPIIISLSSSTIMIYKDMFHTLLIQIIHWFAGGGYQYSHNIRNKEVDILLDALINGICHNNNAMIRDIAANGLNEFFEWSLKQQVSIHHLINDDDGIIHKLILKLIDMSQNPCDNKRLGSALVFNKIYKVFREEKQLISKYVLFITKRLYDSHRLGGKSQGELSYTINN